MTDPMPVAEDAAIEDDGDGVYVNLPNEEDD